MMMTGLFLPQGILDAMIAQAEAGVPHPVCGLLAGLERIVHEIHEVNHVDSSGEHFLGLLEEDGPVATRIRVAGLEHLAVYQSRPTAPAQPLPEEILLTFPPNVVYLILSLEEPLRPTLRGFLIYESSILDVPIQVFNDQEYDPAQDYSI